MIIDVRISDNIAMVISKWLKETGDFVERDEPILEADTDKALITFNAPESGRIEVLKGNVEVGSGDLIARIDTSDTREPKTMNNISPNDIIGR